MNELLLKEIEIICLDDVKLSDAEALHIWRFLDNCKPETVIDKFRIDLLKDMVIIE